MQDGIRVRVRAAGRVPGAWRWPLPALVCMACLACGTSSSPVDAGRDADAVADAVADLPPDIPVDVADVPPDPLDVPSDAPDDAAVPDDAGLPSDAVDVPADVPADVPPPFHWAPGCEGPRASLSWSPVHDATFPRGPLVQMSDRDGVTIAWRTATPVQDEGCVDLSWGAESRTACGVADLNGQYEVPVSGLPPATEIAYSVRVGDLRTAQLTFRTMPDRPVPMKFAVFADSHANEANTRRMADVALAEGVDFAVGVGDLSGAGLPEEFDRTFRGFQDLGTRVNIWAVLGNHDEKYAPGYFDSFVLPQGNEDEIATGLGEGWWARRIGNVWMGGGWIRDFYLSMPDTEWGEVGWFRRQFETEEFQTAQWRLFFIHQPAYVTQWGDTCEFAGEPCLRVALVPLMAAAGIQASFHGHMHGIEWGTVDGVATFVTGGGFDGGMDTGVCQTPEGFPQPWHGIYEIPNFTIVESGCEGLTVRYVDLDGKEITKVEVPATAAPPGGTPR